MINCAKAANPSTIWVVLQLALPYFAGLATALVGFLIREQCRKRDIRTALKYEIFSNAYEFIDLIRVAKGLKEKAEKNEHPLLSIIYSEPLFNAFNSMISNALTGAINKCEKEVFLLYAKFREQDIVFKRKINAIESILSDRCCKTAIESLTSDEIKKFMTDCCPNYAYYCDEIIKWAASFKERFESQFLNRVYFLGEKDWLAFQKNLVESK